METPIGKFKVYGYSMFDFYGVRTVYSKNATSEYGYIRLNRKKVLVWYNPKSKRAFILAQKQGVNKYE